MVSASTDPGIHVSSASINTPTFFAATSSPQSAKTPLCHSSFHLRVKILLHTDNVFHQRTGTAVHQAVIFQTVQNDTKTGSHTHKWNVWLRGCICNYLFKLISCMFKIYLLLLFLLHHNQYYLHIIFFQFTCNFCRFIQCLPPQIV